jgi:putative ABC transport system substrate-binding protein
MMRREIMLAVTGAVMAAGGLRAQQRVLLIAGLLGSEAPGSFGPLLAEFHQGLSDTGYVEGQNLTIVYRWADGRYERLPALASDLVGGRVDVIAALDPAAARNAEAPSRDGLSLCQQRPQRRPPALGPQRNRGVIARSRRRRSNLDRSSAQRPEIASLRSQ